MQIEPHTAYSELNCLEKVIYKITCGRKKFYHVKKPTQWEIDHVIHVRISSLLGESRKQQDEKKWMN